MPGMSIDDNATRSLVAAMSGLATRQKVIGNNLANIDTPGFKASTVSFERELEQAGGTGQGLQLAATHNAHITSAGTLGGGVEITVQQDTTRRLDGNNVDLEREMEALSETVMHYQTATRIITRRLGMLRSVISGGMR